MPADTPQDHSAPIDITKRRRKTPVPQPAESKYFGAEVLCALIEAWARSAKLQRDLDQTRAEVADLRAQLAKRSGKAAR